MPNNDLHEQIARLVKEGFEYPEVAERLGCTSKQVAHVILDHFPKLRKDPGRDNCIRREHRAGKTQKELAEKYGLSGPTIGFICRRSSTLKTAFLSPRC
jgi:DNA-binding CsgD family transcriptional regulator